MKPKFDCTTSYVQFLTLMIWIVGASTQSVYAQQSERDYGDLPDTYSTTAGNNGASHLVNSGFSLGATIDVDLDGIPALAGQPAIGDDTDPNGDDEDGVVLPSQLWACTTTYITVQLTNTVGMAVANLDAWMDFNGNGVFDVDIERITDSSHRPQSLPLVAGINQVPITVPCDAQIGDTYARFRLSNTHGAVNPFDQRGPGEVEDYLVTIAGVSSPGLVSGIKWCESTTNLNGTYDPTDGGLLPTGIECAFGGEVEDYKIDAKLPVELSRFVLTPHADRSVSLDWVTTSETNNAGFEVQQRTTEYNEHGEPEWNILSFVVGHGTTTETQRYSYHVTDLQPGVHQFRLKQIDFDGGYEFTAVIETRISIPDNFLVENVWPNPFSTQASFQFALKEPEWIKAQLYDLLGRPIQTLYEGRPIANRLQTVTIDGSNLPNDVYLVRLVGETVDASQKIILLK